VSSKSNVIRPSDVLFFLRVGAVAGVGAATGTSASSVLLPLVASVSAKIRDVSRRLVCRTMAGAEGANADEMWAFDNTIRSNADRYIIVAVAVASVAFHPSQPLQQSSTAAFESGERRAEDRSGQRSGFGSLSELSSTTNYLIRSCSTTRVIYRNFSHE